MGRKIGDTSFFICCLGRRRTYGIKRWRESSLSILAPRLSKPGACLSRWWEMSLAGAPSPLGNLCMSQELCLPPHSKNHSFPTYLVKGFGVAFQVPPSIMGVLWNGGHWTHSRTWVSTSCRAHGCSSKMSILTLSQTFSLSAIFFFFLAWGRRKRPSHYLSWAFDRPPLRRSLSATAK